MDSSTKFFPVHKYRGIKLARLNCNVPQTTTLKQIKAPARQGNSIWLMRQMSIKVFIGQSETVTGFPLPRFRNALSSRFLIDQNA